VAPSLARSAGVTAAVDDAPHERRVAVDGRSEEGAVAIVGMAAIALRVSFPVGPRVERFEDLQGVAQVPRRARPPPAPPAQLCRGRDS